MQFGQIHFSSWTNAFVNLRQTHFTIGYKHILQSKKIHLAIWTNTSDSWHSAPEKPLYGIQSDAGASLYRALRHQSLHCVELHSAFNLFLSRTIQADTICIALCPASILSFQILLLATKNFLLEEDAEDRSVSTDSLSPGPVQISQARQMRES